MHPDLAALVARPIAHRGLHGCGRPGPVENSLGSARAAIAAGYGIECDVLLSRDGEAMVFHDERLDRLTDASGPLADREVADLTRLALSGSADRIPTLAQLLATIGGRVPLVIEIKSAAGSDMRLVERTLALLADYDGPAAIESFDPSPLRAAKALGTERPIGLVGPIEAGHAPAADVLGVCDFLSWSIEDLARIAALHPSLPRTTWTVRTPAQVAHARALETQIVFEGFAPSVLVNDRESAPPRLSL